jgi:hypothetical protein
MVSHVITWQTDLYYIPQHHLASFRINYHSMNTTALYVIPRGLPCIQGVEVNPQLLT